MKYLDLVFVLLYVVLSWSFFAAIFVVKFK